MPLTDRDFRKLVNTKQNSIEFLGKPSLHGMVDGQMAIEKKSNSQLALYLSLIHISEPTRPY